MKNKMIKFKLISDIGCILCFFNFIKYNIIIGVLGICLSILITILDLKEKVCKL